jgi:hypothetical protein
MAMQGPTLSSGVRKIERALQPMCSIRFDLFYESHKKDRIIRRLQHFSARWVWHVRFHRPFHVWHSPGNELLTIQTSQIAQREGMIFNIEHDAIYNRNGRLEVPSLTAKPLTAMTLNIHGAKKKTVDLQHLLRTQKCDAMGLQETLLNSADFGISIPEHQCFSALGHAAAARRGALVLIRTVFGAEVVGPAHSNWVFVRVLGQEINTLIIIGSVYLPVGAASQLAKRQFAVDIARLTASAPTRL